MTRRLGPATGTFSSVTTDDDTTYPEPDVSEEHPESDHWIWTGVHRPPLPKPFVEYMTRDWGDQGVVEDAHPASARTAERRAALRDRFEGKTLVIPSGGLKVRANDTDFRFRPGSDFYWLTSCDDVDAVVVVFPAGHEPEATLYVEDRRDTSSHRFFSDARFGEVWVGPRRGLDEAASRAGASPRRQGASSRRTSGACRPATWSRSATTTRASTLP